MTDNSCKTFTNWKTVVDVPSDVNSFGDFSIVPSK